MPLRLNSTGVKYRPEIPHDMALIVDGVWDRLVNVSLIGGPWPLVLVGEPGTGKTCAALCLLDFCAGRKFYTVMELCEELIEVQKDRKEYGGAPDSIGAWWKRWKEANCTVLDELGARDKVSDFQYECVKRAIDERHMKPAIFISNLGLDQLARVYDDRIASRLAAGTVIQFTGEDMRLAKAGAA